MDFQKLMDYAKKENIEEIEIFYQVENGVKISVFNSEVDQYQISSDQGLSVRGIYKGKMGSASCQDLSDEKIPFLINAIKESSQLITVEEPFVIFEGSPEYKEIKPKLFDYSKVNGQDKIKLLCDLEKGIKEYDKSIAQVGDVTYIENGLHKEIINSKGLNLKQDFSYSLVYAQAVSQDKEEYKSCFDYQLNDDYNEFDVKKLAKDIGFEVVRKLGGKPIESKKYKVLLKNDVVCSLLGSFASIFSAEAVIKKISSLAGKIDQKVFGENIDIIDDPTTPLNFQRFTFDDEGVATKEKSVVSKGVLNTYLHTLSTAKQMNVEPTGNGFKSSVSSPITVQPCNMYLKQGDKSYKEMLEALGNGVAIYEVQGLHSGINQISGDFFLQASGYMVENGEETKPVSLVVLAGNFYDMFNNVLEIGADFRFGLSNVGASSIIIKELQISGQ